MKSLKIKKFPPASYPVNEAFNTLSTNLSFAGKDLKKIMLTSSHASEGKSFTSMNLMRKLAERGNRVILVDADLRRSVINSTYGVQFEEKEGKAYGLSHYLAGIAELDDVLYQTDIEGAMMVPVGREILNPIPLIVSGRFQELLDKLSDKADYIIVDASPVGVVIDSAEIAKFCDGILLVVNYNEIHRQELLDAKEQLEQTGCPILGTVLNQVDYDNYTGKKYYYKSYYSHYSHYYKKSDEGKKKD